MKTGWYIEKLVCILYSSFVVQKVSLEMTKTSKNITFQRLHCTLNHVVFQFSPKALVFQSHHPFSDKPIQPVGVDGVAFEGLDNNSWRLIRPEPIVMEGHGGPYKWPIKIWKKWPNWSIFHPEISGVMDPYLKLLGAHLVVFLTIWHQTCRHTNDVREASVAKSCTK